MATHYAGTTYTRARYKTSWFHGPYIDEQPSLQSLAPRQFPARARPLQWFDTLHYHAKGKLDVRQIRRGLSKQR